MRKFTILLFILLVGCVDRPYDEAYFVGEGEDVIEPDDDVIEPEEDIEEDVIEDTYEPEEDIVEDVIEPEEDVEEDTAWEFDGNQRIHTLHKILGNLHRTLGPHQRIHNNK